MLGIFKSNQVDDETGKPCIVALMLNERCGISMQGGALAAGSILTFGEVPCDSAFYPERWEKVADVDDLLAAAKGES